MVPVNIVTCQTRRYVDPPQHLPRIQRSYKVFRLLMVFFAKSLTTGFSTVVEWCRSLVFFRSHSTITKKIDESMFTEFLSTSSGGEVIKLLLRAYVNGKFFSGNIFGSRSCSCGYHWVLTRHERNINKGSFISFAIRICG